MSNELRDAFLCKADIKAILFRLNITNTITKIFTDEKRLVQVLKSLLENAIKYTEHGYVELEASLA